MRMEAVHLVEWTANTVDYNSVDWLRNKGDAHGPKTATVLAMTFGRRGLSRLLVAFAVACASPTLPLPPPDAPTMTNGSTPGFVHLAGAPGAAEANADIIVINDNAGPVNKGVVSEVRADGSWDADIAAVNGNVLTITQQFGTTVSTPLKVTVKVP
jgi:hypothetical protein